jgi:hypothetical protein
MVARGRFCGMGGAFAPFSRSVILLMLLTGSAPGKQKGHPKVAPCDYARRGPAAHEF